jgi:DNA-binding transcriptional ArsR family regulator
MLLCDLGWGHYWLAVTDCICSLLSAFITPRALRNHLKPTSKL